MSSRTVAAAVLLAAAAGAAWYAVRRSSGAEFRLPERMHIDELVADLSGTFDRSAVLEEPAGAPVRVGDVTPNEYGHNGAGRRAIVAPPRSRLRFRVRVPPHAALEFSMAVEGDGKRDPEVAGVQFTVQVDHRPVFARTINPAASRHEREWFDGRADLGGLAGREVEITLGTDVAGRHHRLSGTPGWSHVRLVREDERERQLARSGAPNVLVLLIDTLRADRLGCYGASPSPSPALDAAAARGLVFENAVAQSSWTLPSVATIFTGLHPTGHGVGGGADASFLSDTLPTLATLAQAAGITTVGVSGNMLISRGTNLAHGFETFVEFPLDPNRNWIGAGEINRTFLRWLGRNSGYRFLGYLHYMEPHEPYTPSDDLRPAPPPGVRRQVASGRVTELIRDVNFGRAAPLEPPELGYLRRLYDGEIRSWDRALADLLAGLASLGLADSTVLVILADHGEEFQEHGHLGHGTHLYDELLRVPLMIAGPSIRSGRAPELVQGIDVLPSLAGLLGITVPGGLPGRSVLGPREVRSVVSETGGGIAPDGTWMPLESVRTVDWKLIHAPSLQRYELYDLVHDPGEHHDLFGTVPEGAALAELLARWRATAQPAPPPHPEGVDPRLHEKLRALGYVE